MRINNIKELKDKLNKGSKKRRIEAEINNYTRYPEKYDKATLTTLVLNFKELMDNPDTLPSSMSVKKLASTLLTDGRYRELDIDTFREFIIIIHRVANIISTGTVRYCKLLRGIKHINVIT